MSPLTAPVDSLDQELQAIVDKACARIAPNWPLDRLIAVNPYWGWVGRPIEEASAELRAIAGARMLMPRSWYAQQLSAGPITDADIERAIALTSAGTTVAEVRGTLEQERPTLTPHPLVSDLRDAIRHDGRESSWHELVIEQIGRVCESYFDAGQASWKGDAAAGLYTHWRTLTRADASPRVLLGLRNLADAIDELPASPQGVITEAIETLALPGHAREAYLTAVLMSVGGWAATAAHQRWEARLIGQEDDTIVELLAVRLGWELLLYRTATGIDLAGQWTRARREWQERAQGARSHEQLDWVLQRALEVNYQESLARKLSIVSPSLMLRSGPSALGTIRAQAVFCIDVRSEPFRRALETELPDVRTLGFAGFFGLPTAYRSVTGDERPQLPGLLTPSLIAEDVAPDLPSLTAKQHARNAAAQSWRRLSSGAPSTFAFVEATGLGAGLSMLRDAFSTLSRRLDPMRSGLDAAGAKGHPTLRTRPDGTPLDDAARVTLAEGVLRGMSLSEGFARLVVFLGHGASVTNNPQAAGLACGACGGQSGEVNARVLAGLLNDPAVRQGLAEREILIPEATAFVGGVHDTTTDVVVLYPTDEVAATHAEELAEFRAALVRAGRRNRRSRAAKLGITATDDRALDEAIIARAADGSEVRAEWGLAGNAAFIAAPRTRTRGLDLAGRAFLHEYEWRRDVGFEVLESILTAPMVVAHWINFQYYASVVDPERFGSGDKTLHNVVGGNLGVYEGAGGDLRIGLAKQSVHDGTDWVHTPLRLAAYIEAPAAAIDALLAKHDAVRGLVENEWLFLYQIDSRSGSVALRRGPSWVPVVERTFMY